MDKTGQITDGKNGTLYSEITGTLSSKMGGTLSPKSSFSKNQSRSPLFLYFFAVFLRIKIASD
jgi:hypothetical protein